MDTETKKMSQTEVLTKVIEALQKKFPQLLTDSAIKEVISQVQGIPRNFPSTWGGRGKKIRPANKPKGSKNAYIIFATEIRNKIKKENPELPNNAPKGTKSITSMIGEMWEKLSNKSEYENKAKEDIVRYEKEMVNWEKENPTFARKSKKKTEKTSAYHIFCEKNREEVKNANLNKKGREINSILAKKWGSLNDEEKKKYEVKNISVADEDLVIEEELS